MQIEFKPSGATQLKPGISCPPSAHRRAVVISFDRLHPGFLGACGNDWIETPHFDRLAGEAVIFDQHFCDNLDPAAANHAWWTGRQQFPLDEYRQRGCRAFVDDLAARGLPTCLVIETDGRDNVGIAPPFAEVLSVAGSDAFDVPEENTPFARVARRCSQWLGESGTGGPALLWVKSRGVPMPWIPPQAFADLYLAEFGLTDEADEGADAAGPEEFGGPPAAASGEEAPSGPDHSLDWRYAAAMYAAYVTLLDRWLGRLLASVRESPGWEQALLIVTAGAGQSLGEHGPVGDDSLPLRSESVQTPLVIRVPGSDQNGTRRQDLVQATDVVPTLREWFFGAPAGTPRMDSPSSNADGRSLLPLVRNDRPATREFVVLGNGRSEWGIRTRDFFYVEPGDRNSQTSPPAAVLFEKPHDRWDQSDVLSQYPDVSEKLRGILHRQIDELTMETRDLKSGRPK